MEKYSESHEATDKTAPRTWCWWCLNSLSYVREGVEGSRRECGGLEGMKHPCGCDPSKSEIKMDR